MCQVLCRTQDARPDRSVSLHAPDPSVDLLLIGTSVQDRHTCCMYICAHVCTKGTKDVKGCFECVCEYGYNCSCYLVRAAWSDDVVIRLKRSVLKLKTKPKNKNEDEIGRVTPSDWSNREKEAQETVCGLDLGFRFGLIVFAFI